MSDTTPGQDSIYRLRASLATSADGGLPLRLMSLIHRRAVTVAEVHLTTYPSGAQPGSFIAVFRGSPQQAGVLAATVAATIQVVAVALEPLQPAPTGPGGDKGGCAGGPMLTA